MLEQIILGIVQGIVEWLPVSSEGVLILIRTNFFPIEQGLEKTIREVLFLHLGTFLAALLYFRKDVWKVWENKKLFNFLLITTLISGILGYSLLKLFINLEEDLVLSSKIITLIIGLLLLITAYLQIKVNKRGDREIKDLNNKDSWLLGLMQGLSALPGLSRSGLTVSTLLLRKFNSHDALKLSFLMSLPIVLAGNIVLNLNSFSFSLELFVGLIFSFVFGLLTINLLLKIAKKINLGYFVLFFAVLVIASVFV